jgi:hypothetical protein
MCPALDQLNVQIAVRRDRVTKSVLCHPRPGGSLFEVDGGASVDTVAHGEASQSGSSPHGR